MNLVELFRIGSDPEFSFASPDNTGGVHLVSAETLVGSNKELRLRSFIGTDGHPATAELRPNPCNNVYWHMLKWADGLAEVRKAIRYYEEKRRRPLVAVAQPSLGPGETMGGHIWLSLWYKSRLSSEAIHNGNVIWNNDEHEFSPSRQGGPQFKTISSSRLQDYVASAKAGEELSADLCWKKVHFLLHPLEMMLYGPHRAHRAQEVKNPFIRVPDFQSTNDEACYKPNYAYFRFEYRFPTTQLQHPTIAFAYLGLAKLAILNWDLLPNLAALNLHHSSTRLMGASSTAEWRNLLKTRIAFLMDKPEVRVTRDLRGLFDAVDELYKVTLKFPALIDFDAWASLRPRR